MQRNLLIIGIAILAVVAGVLFYSKNKPAENPQPIEVAEPVTPEIVQYPSFTLKDIAGNDREFSEFGGRHRLLNFWATWCTPCRREIPLLKEFQAEQGKDGILIIGIAVDMFESVQSYAEVAEFNYPILIGEEDAMAVAASSGVPFVAMPFTMIVSRDGEFLSAYLGELHPEHLSRIAETLAGLDSGSLSPDDARQALDRL